MSFLPGLGIADGVNVIASEPAEAKTLKPGAWTRTLCGRF